eukprot:5424325-Prymnesium_polylepis.1
MGPDQDPRDVKRGTGASNQRFNLVRWSPPSPLSCSRTRVCASHTSRVSATRRAKWECVLNTPGQASPTRRHVRAVGGAGHPYARGPGGGCAPPTPTSCDAMGGCGCANVLGNSRTRCDPSIQMTPPLSLGVGA